MYRNLSVLLLLFALCLSCGNNEANDQSAEAMTDETTPTAPADERKVAPEQRPVPKELTDEEQIPKGESTDLIANIRTEYANIRKQLDAGSLRVETKEFECENDPGGGELLRYYQGEDLVMMTHGEGSEHSWDSRTIYLKDGDPFFVFQEEGYWRFGGPLNEESPNTIDEITETRYYLNGGKIIQQLTKRYEIKSWEDSPNSNEIPNQTVKEAIGKEYPQLTVIPQLMAGKVGC